MRALTFKEFKETCPAREDCVKDCGNINVWWKAHPMCQVLYKEAIAPDLARQMRDEAKRKKT
jgi:hypothetical protein